MPYGEAILVATDTTLILSLSSRVDNIILTIVIEVLLPTTVVSVTVKLA